jgi:N utilization substance protein A
MASELYNTIDALSREKGIDPQIVVSAVEDAIVMATRKYYKSQENLHAKLDKETGKINAFAVKTVVELPEQVEDPNLQITLEDARKVDPKLEIGGELQIPKVTEGILGRIAAQLAKQVIFQKVREAERDTVYNEYIGRVGEIVNATVKRVEGPDVIFDIGKAEARMPRKEQSRLESFAISERVRVVIARVERASKGPGVVVSRAAPELVQHLFQTEVPEIYDGTVVIRAIAREAGDRGHVEGQRRGRGGRLRRHEGDAGAVDYPRAARGEDRHHRVSRRCGDFCREGVAAGESEPRDRGRQRG